MKHPNSKNSATTTSGRQHTSPLRIHTRRSYRSACSKPRLSPCPEEANKTTHQTSICVSAHSSDQVVAVCEHKFSQQLLSVGDISNRFISPLQMPPGPHTSPVPSPPPLVVPSEDLLLHENLDGTEGNSAALPIVYSTSSTSRHTKCPSLRRRLARRRNAICDSTLGKGLKDFFVSYVVSNLTDSMTSALNLDVSGNPVTSAAVTSGHNFTATSTVTTVPLCPDTDATME